MWRNVLIYVFSTFNFRAFCYRFYEGFIPKIILVSWFYFLFVSVIYSKSRFDTWIFRDSFAMPLLKTLSRLPQSVAFYAWFCFTRLPANFPFRAFVTMICRASTEVLLNLTLGWIQLCFLLTLRKLIIFELPVLIPLVFYLIHAVSGEGALYCISRIRFRRAFIWHWVNQYMVYGFDSSSTGHFPAMVCSISAEGSLKLVAHWI